MKLKDVMKELDRLAPLALAESWDKVGLHAGDPQAEVGRAMVCIDLTDAVLAEAQAASIDLVVAYHPPIFAPLTEVTPRKEKSRLIFNAVRSGIAIYSPHTALDAAEGGVNDWLAGVVSEGRGHAKPIKPHTVGDGKQYKLVVFVPHDVADKLRDAMAAAGAGVIGDYTQCSYGLEGQGTFKGGESSNPTVGEKGQLERVEELRLEMVCSGRKLGAAIEALRASHPYEEPAFDIYRLEPDPSQPSPTTGAGRVVRLDEPVDLATLVSRLKSGLNVKHLRVAEPDGFESIQSIGLCPGAGASLLPDAGPVDAFVTGEMRHHDVLAARADGTAVLLAGHTHTERPYLPIYCDRLAKRTGKEVAWQVSKADKAPWQDR